MKFITYMSRDFSRQIAGLSSRCAYPPEIEEPVRKIMEDVRRNGDKAVSRYALKFDKARMKASEFVVRADEISSASARTSPALKKAVALAAKNIASFAKSRIPRSWKSSPRKGVVMGEQFAPYRRIGVYIPGGFSPLVSTSLHTICIAKAAGVKEIVAVTPPGKGGRLLPEMLYAMSAAGATEIYRLGGVYAIAALAYGTETVKKVEKIVGPGNAFVTAAKKMAFGEVAIDMIAGPSEIMVIADGKGNPDFAAADLLSQAEHGTGHEQAVVVSDSSDFLRITAACVKRQASLLKQSPGLLKVMERGMFFIQVKDMAHAVEIANSYAPEHLEIFCAGAAKLAEGIQAAGAVFIGEWTPEPVGDFVAGPSHVLPTGGSARYFSGLRVEDFFRRSSILAYTKDALAREYPAIAKFAEVEGLQAHGRSAGIRLL